MQREDQKTYLFAKKVFEIEGETEGESLYTTAESQENSQRNIGIRKQE